MTAAQHKHKHRKISASSNLRAEIYPVWNDFGDKGQGSYTDAACLAFLQLLRTIFRYLFNIDKKHFSTMSNKFTSLASYTFGIEVRYGRVDTRIDRR